MTAQIKTKSNYNNLNGQWLKVVEILGNRVTCEYTHEIYGTQQIDFTLKEVVAMQYVATIN